LVLRKQKGFRALRFGREFFAPAGSRVLVKYQSMSYSTSPAELS